MEKQSNSKYYHGDCVCEKKKVPSLVAIECEDCITDDPSRYEHKRRGYECNCVDVEIIHEICKTCAADRDILDDLTTRLDELMYNITYDIKNFVNCEEKLHEVSEISKEMRHLNRKLLTRLVETNKNKKVEEKEEKENVECSECNITLERYRDGDIKEGLRCNNCYWEDKEGKESKHMIIPDYRSKNIKEKKVEEEDEEESTDNDKCEMCDNNIDLNSDNVIELIRETEQVKETFLICIDCFQKNADHLRTESWDVDEYLEQEVEKEKIEEAIKLCENTDCERYPPDWDDEEDTESTYQEGQWKKCCLCDGYFDDDGFGDILFVQEEPNNQEASCDLCGKENNIVQMKGSGQYLCEAACDEDDEDEEEEENEKDNEKESENVVEYHVVTTMYGGFDIGYCYAGEREYEDEDEALKYYNEISLVTLNESKYTGGVQYKRIESGKAHKLENGEYETVYLNENREETVNEDEEESEDEVDEDDEKTGTCDICCRNKSFENYYVFKRGRKQELYSCVKCWENRKTQLVGETWTWTSHTFPGPAFYTVEKDEEEKNEPKKWGIQDDNTDWETPLRCNEVCKENM